MRISIFTDTLCDTNGVSRFLQDLSKIAYQRGTDLFVHTATIKLCARPNPNIKIQPPLYRIKMPFYPQLDLSYLTPKEVASLLDRFRPDIVHISTPGPIGLVAKREAKKRHIPIAATYHTDFPAFIYKKTKSKLIKEITFQFMKHFYKDFDLILTRSNFYRNILIDELDIPQEHLHTLQAGIDLSQFHPDFQKRGAWRKLGVPQEGIKILYVGRMSEEKRISLLLAAWKAMQKRCDGSLILVGEADEKMQKKINALPNVFYLGKRVGEELSFLYAASDLFVTPSITETLGQTIIEAMASALPLVVAAQGGHREYVEESFASIVESDDPKDWAKEIVKLCQERDNRLKMGSKARAKALTMSIEKSFEDFIEVHQKLITPLFSKTL